MPPKRKRTTATEETTTAATTRKSTRSKAATSKAKAETPSSEPEEQQEAPPKKKSRATRTPAKTDDQDEQPAKSKSRSRKTAAARSSEHDDEHQKSTTKAASSLKAETSSKAKKSEPYSKNALVSLFQQYADADDPNVIGPEGLERVCSEGDIPLEGPLPIILAWQLDGKEMGKFTKEEWISGLDPWKISNLVALKAALSELEDLLLLNKPPVKAGGKSDPYDRTKYSQYAANPKAAFKELYSFSFGFAKPEQSRNIDMETSVAFWSVLLVPRHRIMSDVLEFIQEKGTYRATNKDLWNMMLEFCSTVDQDLKDYEDDSDGSWPTLIDEFVAWKQQKNKANGDA